MFRFSGLRWIPARLRTLATEVHNKPNELNLTLASPGQVFYEKKVVKQVDIPGMSGMLGVVAEHVPTIGVLKPGLVNVTEEDGVIKKIFVSSGSFTVNADSTIQILAEEAVTIDMLDAQAIREGLSHAQSELNSASSEQAKAEKQILLETYESLQKAVDEK
ncbi:ATP synthase subunit delta, mitochondrial [Cichlidogyrus casuarinus]|uniref:F-ATPase delta subunit n=1 Tax=Cichlidogyrus casuarinus TaxID=1844966 RepID=A0ABD2PUP0_9PLAT